MENKRIMTNDEYKRYVSDRTPKSNTLLDCLKAFAVGGTICLLGQGLHDLWALLGVGDNETVGTLTSITLVFLGAALTGLGVYDRIGKFAGAGSIVPITGFANSVVAPAMEFKTEGYVMGVGAKIFILAGPVILYGTIASVVVGLLTALI
ncbi:MAG: stage V sporulation protein AC [Eubacteriales bacterium]|nr:stage V sporulation protein AC [Eubacteriales bacterium]